MMSSPTSLRCAGAGSRTCPRILCHGLSACRPRAQHPPAQRDPPYATGTSPGHAEPIAALEPPALSIQPSGPSSRDAQQRPGAAPADRLGRFVTDAGRGGPRDSARDRSRPAAPGADPAQDRTCPARHRRREPIGTIDGGIPMTTDPLTLLAAANPVAKLPGRPRREPHMPAREPSGWGSKPRRRSRRLAAGAAAVAGVLAGSRGSCSPRAPPAPG